MSHPNNKLETFKNFVQLPSDHYSGLFEMIEEAGKPSGAVRVFLLLGKKGIYLLRFCRKSEGLTHERIADGLPNSPRKVEADRAAEGELRWAEVVGACGELGFDLVLIAVGAATSGLGGTAIIAWKVAGVGASAVKCGIAYEAWDAFQDDRQAWKDSDVGRTATFAVDAFDMVVSVKGAFTSASLLSRGRKTMQKVTSSYGRSKVEAMMWHEAAKTAFVHLPKFGLASHNLLTSTMALSSDQVRQLILRTEPRPNPNPFALFGPVQWLIDGSDPFASSWPSTR